MSSTAMSSEFAHLIGDHTKQMQGDRLVRLSLQYLLIDALGFG